MMIAVRRGAIAVLLLVTGISRVSSAEPQQRDDNVVLFRRAVTDDSELVVTRGPDRPVTSLTALAGPKNVERLEAVWELRVQLMTKDAPALTLMTQLRPIFKPGDPLTPPGWNFKGLKTVTDYAVLDLAWRPIEIQETAIFSEEIVFASRINGGLILTQLNPVGGYSKQTQLDGWSAYSTAEKGNPTSATLSKVDDRWVVEVTSGHVTAPRVTKFKQVSRTEWRFEQVKE